MRAEMSEVETLLVSAAAELVSKKEAEYFSENVIRSHLAWIHKLDLLKEAVEDLHLWSKSTVKEFTITVDREASLLLDLNKLPPSPKVKYIHDELEDRAKKFGISMIGAFNVHAFRTLRFWVEPLADRGLVGLCLFNGGPYGVVPFGGTSGIFGTNPLVYAIPADPYPIVVDMATSEAPYFELANAKKEKTVMRPGTIVDFEGKPTTDPFKAESDEAANLLPMGGGYKGYAVVLLIEILTGALVRSKLSTEMTDPKINPYVHEEHGGLLVAIDIASFTDISKFKKSVSEMCAVIRRQKPAPGVDKILVPGDGSHERIEKGLASGVIDVDEGLYEKLVALSK